MINRFVGHNTVRRLLALTALAILVVVMLALPGKFRSMLPLTMGCAAPAALVFFAVGHWVEGGIKALMNARVFLLVTISIVAAAGILYIAVYMGPVDMDVGKIPQPFVFFMTAILGTAGIIAVASILNMCCLGDALGFIGKNSLAIFMTEYIIREIVGCKAFNGEIVRGMGVGFLLFILAEPITFMLNNARKVIDLVLPK